MTQPNSSEPNVSPVPANDAASSFLNGETQKLQPNENSSTLPPTNAEPLTTQVQPNSSTNQALETGKVTMTDAMTALKQLHQDPNQGIAGALEALGESRAFNVGLALCILFPVMGWSAIVRGLGLFRNFLGGWTGLLFELDVTAHLKGLIASGVPVMALILGLMAIRSLFKAKGTPKQFTFIAGICLLPLSLNFFLLWLFGVKGLELSGLLGIFSFSSLVLLLNSSLVGVMGLSAQKSLWLVPTLLVAIVFMTQVMVEILT